MWLFSEARGAKYSRPGLASVAFVRFSQGGAPSDQVQGPFVHLINLKSAAPQRAGLFRGLPPAAEETETKPAARRERGRRGAS